MFILKLFFYLVVGGGICIYGGLFDTSTTTDPGPPINQIAFLDTTTLKWSIPQLDNPKIPNLAYHSATSSSRLMLIAFGKLLYFLKEKVCDILTYMFILFREYYRCAWLCTK